MVLDIVGLQISVPELIWTVICFFLLMFLLDKLLYKPIFKVMDARNAKIAAGLDEGRAAQNAMTENDGRLAAELLQTGNDAKELISARRSDAEEEKSRLIAEARSNADGISREIREKLLAEEADAVSDIGDELPVLVALLSEKLLGTDDAAKHPELLNECISAAED